MNELIPSYEIGSLPKPNARVKAIGGELDRITQPDIDELFWFGKYSGVDPTEAIDIIQRNRRDRTKLTDAEKDRIISANTAMNIKAIAKVLVYKGNGEGPRKEMYRNLVEQVDGFEDLPEMLRSRGPDSWRAAVCVDEPRLKTLKTLDTLPVIKEFEFMRHVLGGEVAYVKIPLDDPFMVANMSDNRLYIEQMRSMYRDNPVKAEYEAKRALTLALAYEVIRPQAEALAKAGVKWIQLDIPSSTIDINHIPILVEGINATVEGIEGVKFSLHFCYPKRVSLIDKNGYDLLFPHVLNLSPNVNHFSLELANGSQYKIDLAPFAKYQSERAFEIGVGVTDITSERQEKGLIETPQIVRERLLKSIDVLGDSTLVYAAHDCGLRQLSLGRAVRLNEILAEGAELARRG